MPKAFFKFQLLLHIVLLTGVFSAQTNNPYALDGFFTLHGSIDLKSRHIHDKNGQEIGKPGYDMSNFDNTYYINAIPYTGIIYKVEKQRLAAVGEVLNGKKNGLWIECITNQSNEHVNQISNVFEFKDGVLIKKKVKDLNYEDPNCLEQGFFSFIAPKQNIGVLTDPEGVLSTSDEYDGYGKPMYTLEKKIFNGIAYVNESGACYVLIGNYKNGFPHGLMIDSNEGGYVYGFGLMNAGNKTGRWIENQYTGEPRKIIDYLNNQATGSALFFNEGQMSGVGTYENGELIGCEGNCEE
jgi:hypothetical protein